MSACPPPRASSMVKSRPITGDTPRTLSKSYVAVSTGASPRPAMTCEPLRASANATSSTSCDCWRQRDVMARSRTSRELVPVCRMRWICTSEPGSRYGRGRKSMRSTTESTATFAPMPSPNVATAPIVNHRARTSDFTAYRIVDTVASPVTANRRGRATCNAWTAPHRPVRPPSRASSSRSRRVASRQEAGTSRNASRKSQPLLTPFAPLAFLQRCPPRADPRPAWKPAPRPVRVASAGRTAGPSRPAWPEGRRTTM